MRFLNWYILFLIIPLIYLFFRKYKKRTIKVSNVEIIKVKLKKNNKFYNIGKYMIFLGLCLVTIALARPQLEKNKQNLKKEGIDIVVSLDVSGSMQSIDFKPNRLGAAKQVMLEFIKKRTNDRAGLVVFAGGAYTKLPLTFDYMVIKDTVKKIDFNEVKNNNRTAIGLGISVAVNRLKKSDAKSKIIILATDGSNNAGDITPESAAKLAQDLGIKIYTIGVGSDHTIFRGMRGVQRGNSDLDEILLKDIAKLSDGKYFRAKDRESLEEVFATIDSLEKTKIDNNELFLRKEIYKIFLRFGLALLLIGLFLDRYRMIKIP